MEDVKKELKEIYEKYGLDFDRIVEKIKDTIDINERIIRQLVGIELNAATKHELEKLSLFEETLADNDYEKTEDDYYHDIRFENVYGVIWIIGSDLVRDVIKAEMKKRGIKLTTEAYTDLMSQRKVRSILYFVDNELYKKLEKVVVSAYLNRYEEYLDKILKKVKDICNKFGLKYKVNENVLFKDNEGREIKEITIEILP